MAVLAAVAALALPIVPAPDTPAESSWPVPVFQPVVEVVAGHDARYWHRRAVRSRRLLVVQRGRTRRLQRAFRQTTVRLGTSGLERAFLCIHDGEGAWTANTGNGFYGGLQMDSSFERSYGGEFFRAWGHASAWPPAVQLTVAMRAFLSGRGFAPWPNTSRMCGLR